MMYEFSEAIYEQAQAEGAAPTPSSEDDVVDADFEIVDEEEKDEAS